MRSAAASGVFGGVDRDDDAVQHDDGSGWFPVLDDAAWFPEHLLFESRWVKPARTTFGSVRRQRESVQRVSDRVKVAIDNSAIVASTTQLRRRHHGDIAWSAPMELVCPVI